MKPPLEAGLRGNTEPSSYKHVALALTFLKPP